MSIIRKSYSMRLLNNYCWQWVGLHQLLTVWRVEMSGLPTSNNLCYRLVSETVIRGRSYTIIDIIVNWIVSPVKYILYSLIETMCLCIIEPHDIMLSWFCIYLVLIHSKFCVEIVINTIVHCKQYFCYSKYFRTFYLRSTHIFSCLVYKSVICLIFIAVV